MKRLTVTQLLEWKLKNLQVNSLGNNNKFKIKLQSVKVVVIHLHQQP